MTFAIRRAVGAVAPWLPFQTLCLQQAIAARAMLGRRGIGRVLHLGVRDPIGMDWRRALHWTPAGSMSPAIQSIWR